MEFLKTFSKGARLLVLIPFIIMAQLGEIRMKIGEVNQNLQVVAENVENIAADVALLKTQLANVELPADATATLERLIERTKEIADSTEDAAE